jgi:hypothetical protein
MADGRGSSLDRWSRKLLVGSSNSKWTGKRRPKAEEGSLDRWSRKLLVGSSNRKWTGKRRPMADGRGRQPGQVE